MWVNITNFAEESVKNIFCTTLTGNCVSASYPTGGIPGGFLDFYVGSTDQIVGVESYPTTLAHVIITIDVTTVSVYVNGFLYPTCDISTANLTLNQNSKIGFGIATGKLAAIGEIYLFAVYDSVINQATATDLYNAGLPNQPPYSASQTFSINETDLDGNVPLDVVFTSLPSNGTIKFNNNPVSLAGSYSMTNLVADFIFTPNQYFNGINTFTYFVQDSS